MVAKCKNSACTDFEINFIAQEDQPYTWVAGPHPTIHIGKDGNPIIFYWLATPAGPFYLRVVNCKDI